MHLCGEEGQCLSKGSKVTLTVESVTALRNLHDAPANEEARPGAAAQGGAAAQTPHRDGAARLGDLTCTISQNI